MIFAAFFYPMAVLIGVGAVLILTIAVLAVLRCAHTYQHRHGMM